MATKLLIPTPLRPYTKHQDAVLVEGATVGEALRNLTELHPELKRHLYGDSGQLRSFVNVFLGDTDIRSLDGENTRLRGDEVITIVPSVAGGAGSGLDSMEVARYSRHLIMPEVGMDGQKKLKAASVLCIGTGGLGSPLGLYLAAAGVGRIGLVDFDVVDYSNLQRQVLYGTSDVGRPKLEAARERLADVNPHVTLETHGTRLSSENALEILGKYDVIVDGTDNFPTRYLVNDASVLLGKPNVYGSIFRFEGQASVFWAGKGPCYRCLYPEPPPPGLVPSCAEGGVLGVLPGIIGTIQATETIKLILGTGQPLMGRLLLFDALEMRFRELKLRRDPRCPICGENPTIRELVDYAEFCGVSGPGEPVLAADRQIAAADLKARLDRGDRLVLMDVRTTQERAICQLEGSIHIPMDDVPSRMNELDSRDEIVTYCKVGVRSAKVLQFLQQAGFQKVKNLRGGIDAWAREVDPSVPRY